NGRRGRLRQRLAAIHGRAERGHAGLVVEVPARRGHPEPAGSPSARLALVRVAVVSDVHANLHALEAVLAAIDADAPDELWCLGDLVGYGPRPNECCWAIEERAAICLAGNHDLAVRGTIDLM